MTEINRFTILGRRNRPSPIFSLLPLRMRNSNAPIAFFTLTTADFRKLGSPPSDDNDGLLANIATLPS